MAEAVKKEPNVLLEVGKAILGPGYRPGQFAASGRELGKDIQQTYHDVAFGQPMHSPEPGTNALNPTPQLITEELKGKAVDEKTDQITQNEPQVTVHGPQTTLDKLRSFAQERAGVALDNMENAHQHQKEQNGLER